MANSYQLLTESDSDLAVLLKVYGEPPAWRRPNDFTSLATIIIEQQVSQASARQTVQMFNTIIGQLTVENVLAASPEQLRSAYVSRQKAAYLRGLAQACSNGSIHLSDFETMSDDMIRTSMLQLKGIGNWTVDIYLLMVLGRPDIFPIGDVALQRTMRAIKRCPKADGDYMLTIAETWRPWRSYATKLLWHAYLCDSTLRRRIA